ncbi:50S ribosomal protein L16 [Candidatus Woesebacteria bacterium RIFCSPHIGHO2_02_FULL_42_20]|uniref:Large ribosomal subunit protein uL16 n=1 Tax=Candidatus Woesebacteria bacterium RIFCSPHIGHO2_12_FULL_41_24 TaxID=1802510 RepID=A0A1F8APX7_9BACT|nr:MAG: 50S ribosomal protein L16 [Candidatus Woesebacteria bacterium RBG_16_41_13]OGM29242.1 MAG: 50S ribosomal protein L16 [Candidatus Woesebacteria bacterium RIFCSPHIGHO2_01_FULL_42_80]OGM34740.1 MAG: 50S ribosomal protein L16 [Candidatus Woesebacteria bacterium RIFCSPHIGHO2_02_FULL_42_20]OGM53671.1 MAG: 50S ribosomal protein L16 [Candidatus Woesebacteria bacterium RIFCSPHIGHO2_12_FULL_41_24]OGM67039.1 MAG: 50S ribosomal protein L16 [Candidatus Woesebacteria bacterium RIFCSPLOWO2_01_FULL_42_
MLQPKRTKFRKSFRGRRKGIAVRGSKLSFGEYGLKSLGTTWMSAAQIEAARRAVTHYLKRKGRMWIRIFPDKPVTARAAGQRMGGGKGDIDRYVAVIKPGRVLFEVAGVPEEVAREAFNRAAVKLPVKTKLVRKEKQ